LFHPFIIQRFFKLKLVNSIKEAKKRIKDDLNLTVRVLVVIIKNMCLAFIFVYFNALV